MAVLETVYILGFILSILTGVDQIVGTAMARNKKLAITQDAQKALNQLIKEKGDVEGLLNAAQTRDVKLGRQILYSSPIGTRFKKLEKEYSNNLDTIKNYNDDIANRARVINDETQKLENQINAIPDTGSYVGNAVSDLINGASKNKTQGTLSNAMINGAKNSKPSFIGSVKTKI